MITWWLSGRRVSGSKNNHFSNSSNVSNYGVVGGLGACAVRLYGRQSIKILVLEVDTTKPWIRSNLLGDNNIVLFQADEKTDEYMKRRSDLLIVVSSCNSLIRLLYAVSTE